MKISNTKLLTNTVLVSMLTSSLVFAQAPAQTSNQDQALIAQLKKTTKPENDFKLDLGIEYSQKIAADEKGERESGTDISMAPSYKLSKNLTLAAKSVVTKENSGARQTSLSNTDLKLAIKGFKINEEMKTLHSLSMVAPTNEDTQKIDRLRTSIATSNGLEYKTSFIKLIYSMKISKNFHEFTVNAEGSPNIEYRLSNSLDLTIPVTDKFSLTALGSYRVGQTYGGFQHNSFSIDADLNYDILDQLSINLGTSNDGNVAKSNGVDSNLSAYNENTSVVRLGLSLSL